MENLPKENQKDHEARKERNTEKNNDSPPRQIDVAR